LRTPMTCRNATIGGDPSPSDYDDLLGGSKNIGNVLQLPIVTFGDLGNGHGRQAKDGPPKFTSLGSW